MNAQLTIDECKLMWVVGALQRLATLGMIGPDIPLKLSGSAVDDYLYIDEHREILFTALVNSECDPKVQNPDDTKPLIELLLQYKNNRTEIVKYALSQQVI